LRAIFALDPQQQVNRKQQLHQAWWNLYYGDAKSSLDVVEKDLTWRCLAYCEATLSLSWIATLD
jgi:hypothetical protein